MLIGVVGKPNCGKSTFFKAATLAEVEIANRPFVTIKPNRGYGFIKIECADKEFKLQCNPKTGYCLNQYRFVPIELLDVAGLVPGAHKGYGLGNQFLDDLRQADAFVHVIDISGSTNEMGETLEHGAYNPANDIRFLETELTMWLFQIIKKGWERFARTVKQENLNLKEELAKQLSGLKITEEYIANALKSFDEDPTKWSDADILELAGKIRKSKPMVIAANKADSPHSMDKIKILQEEFPEYKIIPCSAESELALREAAKSKLISYVPGENDFQIINKNKLNSIQQSALDFINGFLKMYNSTGVQETLNTIVFNLLNQIIVFPVENENKLADSQGHILPDTHILLNGSTAIELAEKVHTDIAKKFSSAIDARTKKRLGRDYKLKNRDIIRIITS